MFSKILVPLDGSDHSAQIVWQVKRLALAEQSEIELFTAVVPILESWRERHDDRKDRDERHPTLRLQEAERHLEALAQTLRDAGLTAHARVERGHASDSILRRAEEIQASLIAVATHGRSGPSLWLRGSVTQRLLQHSGVPVLVLNPSAKEEAAEGVLFKRVLVPLDGSTRSAQVLPLAQQFATAHQAELVLHAVGATPVDNPVNDGMVDYLERLQQKLADAGANARVRADYGDPAKEILTAVEDEQIDLVVIGTHGQSGLEKWVMGSVTEKVIRRCPTPLLVQRTASTS
ncbi:MAG: universal stress protein [Planctomycetota bacterium]